MMLPRTKRPLAQKKFPYPSSRSIQYWKWDIKIYFCVNVCVFFQYFQCLLNIFRSLMLEAYISICYIQWIATFIIVQVCPPMLSFHYELGKGVFFHPLIFSLCVSLDLKWVSFRQHVLGPCSFNIHQATGGYSAQQLSHLESMHHILECLVLVLTLLLPVRLPAGVHPGRKQYLSPWHILLALACSNPSCSRYLGSELLDEQSLSCLSAFLSLSLCLSNKIIKCL